MTLVLIWSFTGLMFVICVIFLVRYLRESVLNPEGKGCEKQTAKRLRSFGAIRGFKVLSDVTIEVDGKTAYIENMLIGFFGVLLVTTCGRRGEYYGTLTDPSWAVTGPEGRDKVSISNPVPLQRQAAALLRELFAKNKVYKVPVETIVYISNRSRKTGVFITHGEEILRPGQLGAHLAKTKYETDNGLDVEKLAGIVQAGQVQKQS